MAQKRASVLNHLTNTIGGHNTNTRLQNNIE